MYLHMGSATAEARARELAQPAAVIEILTPAGADRHRDADAAEQRPEIRRPVPRHASSDTVNASAGDGGQPAAEPWDTAARSAAGQVGTPAGTGVGVPNPGFDRDPASEFRGALDAAKARGGNPMWTHVTVNMGDLATVLDDNTAMSAGRHLLRRAILALRTLRDVHSLVVMDTAGDTAQQRRALASADAVLADLPDPYTLPAAEQ